MKNRVKAVEMSIFAVVSLIFLNSAYNLLTDSKFSEDSNRKPLATATTTREREPAAAKGTGSVDGGTQGGISGFVPYETKCKSTGETFETNASKVRILGPFCGCGDRQVASENAAPLKPDALLVDYRIENVTSHYVATVFSDHSQGKFSTDFIPLENGSNKVTMEFKYKSGRVYPVELTIVRKP